MKQLFILVTLAFCAYLLPAQVQRDSGALLKKDSLRLSLHKDSVRLTKLPVQADSVVPVKKDTVLSAAAIYFNRLNEAIRKSSFLNAAGPPTAMANKERRQANNDLIFYFLMLLLILLAFLRVFFSRYFYNLFRVFFNTSLRQGQLTDQLLQAKQASMFFNILFFFTAGFYTYLLLQNFNWVQQQNSIITILICVVIMAVIYFLKFLNLKFTGWLTGYHEQANTYLFIIFLINKILGIILIPIVIVIAFSPDYLKKSALVISLLIVGIMFLLRFIRSFSLLHNQIKVSRFHFFLYVLGIEIMPVLLIYKGAMILLNKNL